MDCQILKIPHDLLVLGTLELGRIISLFLKLFLSTLPAISNFIVYKMLESFQEWIDYTVSENVRSGGIGLCVEGWRYVVKGTLKNTSIRINALIVSKYQYFDKITFTLYS